MTTSSVSGSFMAFLGRILIAGYLLIQGIFNAMSFSSVIKMMNSIQYIEGLMMLIVFLQFAAGLFILFGWLTRFGGFLMLVIIAILAWLDIMLSQSMLVAQSPLMNLMHYTSYLCYGGAAFYLMAFGAGKCGFDQLRRRHKKEE